MSQNKYWYFLQASLHFSGILLNNENLPKMLFDTMNKYEYACMTVVKTKYCVFSSFFDMCSHCHLKEDRIFAFNLEKVLNYWGLEGRHFLTGGDWVFPLFWNTFDNILLSPLYLLLRYQLEHANVTFTSLLLTWSPRIMKICKHATHK